jgi:Tfp pilus assembly protein PilW
MRKRYRNSQGFTLTEVLVTSVFALTVLGTLYGFYRMQLHNLRSQEKRTEVLEAARAVMDLMVREIREAGNWSGTGGVAPPGCARVQGTPTATQLRVQMDLNRDGDCADRYEHEDVTYTYNPAREAIERNSSTSPVASNVYIPSESDFLTYYSAGSTVPLTHPISDATVIKRIKITFEVRVDDPTPDGKAAGRKLKTPWVSNVTLRNN